MEIKKNVHGRIYRHISWDWYFKKFITSDLFPISILPSKSYLDTVKKYQNINIIILIWMVEMLIVVK